MKAKKYQTALRKHTNNKNYIYEVNSFLSLYMLNFQTDNKAID